MHLLIFSQKGRGAGGCGCSHKLTLNNIYFIQDFCQKPSPRQGNVSSEIPYITVILPMQTVILFQKKLLGVTEAVTNSTFLTTPPPHPRENMIGALASTELGCHSSYYPHFQPLYLEFDYWHGWYVGCYLSLPTFILCPVLQRL